MASKVDVFSAVRHDGFRTPDLSLHAAGNHSDATHRIPRDTLDEPRHGTVAVWFLMALMWILLGLTLVLIWEKANP